MFARSPRGWQRFLAGSLALWIAALSVDLPILHACSMHGVGAIAARAVAPAMSGGAHHVRPSVATERSSDADHSSRRHACTCLGQCCAATRVALPATQVALAFGSSAAPAAVVGHSTGVVSSWSGFALPFATAPPSA